MNIAHASNSKSRMLALAVCLIGCMALFTFVTTARVHAQQESNTNITDAKITHAVQRQLMQSDEVPAHLIDINTLEGVVTLSGQVSHLLAHDRAADLARTIKGVRTVINNIDVAPSNRSDEQIREDITEALYADPATDTSELSVEVKAGTAILNGTVESWPERHLAETVVRSVRGVRSVDNAINVDLADERSKQEIAADVKRRLASDVWVDDMLVDVTVDGSVVTLTGTVGSSWERQRAIADAWVTGVSNVKADDLEVTFVAREDMQRTDWWSSATDSQITAAINDALMFDPRVSMFSVDVSVDDGVVTLDGRVNNLAAKTAATEIAQNTIGVNLVHNMMMVRPDQLLSNQSLQDKVEGALERDPYLSDEDIGVTVQNGEVKLRGTVESEFEKNHAIDVVERIDGVAAVSSTLVFASPAAAKSDWALEQDIGTELFWSPIVDEADITIDVKDGVATLTGTVDTWREAVVAVNRAYDAGAAKVKNDLKLTWGKNLFVFWQ